MAEKNYNIVIVAQAGRLEYEAVLFLASLREMSPNFKGRVLVAVPKHNHRWKDNPDITSPAVKEKLVELGGEIIPFENTHFGQHYPYGNKIECLLSMPKGEPFVFFDTDTLITGDLNTVPFDFDQPSASLKVEGTWPKIELYGPKYSDIWGALYKKFDLDFQSSLDLNQPEEFWRRYLYFNAGFFYYKCPVTFGQQFLEYALSIRDDTPQALECQSFDPWLDQVALPLVIHKLGGRRTTDVHDYLDGQVSYHYRFLSLFFACACDRDVDILKRVTAPNKIKKILKEYEPFKTMIYQNRGQKARSLFDRDHLPHTEIQIRKKLKNHNLWIR